MKRMGEPDETPQGWQPIETAPRDTALLLWTGWSYQLGHFNTSLNGWRAGWDNRPIECTHWMPLPVPPSGVREGKSTPFAQLKGALRGEESDEAFENAVAGVREGVGASGNNILDGVKCPSDRPDVSPPSSSDDTASSEGDGPPLCCSPSGFISFGFVGAACLLQGFALLSLYVFFAAPHQFQIAIKRIEDCFFAPMQLTRASEILELRIAHSINECQASHNTDEDILRFEAFTLVGAENECEPRDVVEVTRPNGILIPGYFSIVAVAFDEAFDANQSLDQQRSIVCHSNPNVTSPNRMRSIKRVESRGPISDGKPLLMSNFKVPVGLSNDLQSRSGLPSNRSRLTVDASQSADGSHGSGPRNKEYQPVRPQWRSIAKYPGMLLLGAFLLVIGYVAAYRVKRIRRDPLVLFIFLAGYSAGVLGLIALVGDLL